MTDIYDKQVSIDGCIGDSDCLDCWTEAHWPDRGVRIDRVQLASGPSIFLRYSCLVTLCKAWWNSRWVSRFCELHWRDILCRESTELNIGLDYTWTYVRPISLVRSILCCFYIGHTGHYFLLWLFWALCGVWLGNLDGQFKKSWDVWRRPMWNSTDNSFWSSSVEFDGQLKIGCLQYSTGGFKKHHVLKWGWIFA